MWNILICCTMSHLLFRSYLVRDVLGYCRIEGIWISSSLPPLWNLFLAPFFRGFVPGYCYDLRAARVATMLTCGCWCQEWGDGAPATESRGIFCHRCPSSKSTEICHWSQWYHFWWAFPPSSSFPSPKPVTSPSPLSPSSAPKTATPR